MHIIFLTGTIGSGKSAASAILKKLGAQVINSDLVARDILNPGTPGWQDTVNAFGQDILTPQGVIDRPKLAQKVFSNPQALEKLNNIVHPRVNTAIDAQINHYRAQGADTVVIEAALVVDSNWLRQAEQSWVLKSSKEVTLKRLKSRGLNDAESLARMAAQPPPEDKIQRGLVIIENNGDMEALRASIENLWNQMHNEDRG
jgi:dephospho-CoA kinase